MAESPTILIAFDGSSEAERALDYAVHLFPTAHLEVVSAYEPTSRQAVRKAGAPGVAVVDLSDDTPEEDPNYVEAVAACQQAVQRVESYGAHCNAHVVETATSTWSAIVDAARALGADVVVTGTKLSGGIKGLLTNSTSENVLHNAGIPVLIVPPKDTTPR